MKRLPLLVLALALVACSPTPTPTPEPTATPRPTSTPAPTDTPEPTEPALLATRDNPLSVGEVFILRNREAGWEIAFGPTEVQRGEEAMATLKAANMLNPVPDDGNEWVLIKLQANVKGEAPEALRSWDPTPWAVVVDGRPFDGKAFSGAVLPDPAFKGEVIPPGMIEGWAAWQIPAGGNELVFLRDSERGGYWFDLGE